MNGTGSEREGLYYLDQPRKETCNSVQTLASSLWHQRLGHPSNKVFQLFPFVKNKSCNTDKCLICPLAKQTRSPFPLSFISSKVCFDLIHVDIWGGYKIASLSGAKYFLTIVDDFTRSTWVNLMKHKSDTRSSS